MAFWTGISILSAAILAANPDSYELVPGGFNGKFEGFNQTKILEEQSADPIFDAFEKLYQKSKIEGNNFTEKERKSINKFKIVQNMVIYLQEMQIFGQYIFYGCHCFSKGPKNLLEAVNPLAGPVDKADRACRSHSRCHQNAKLKFGDQCDLYTEYDFEGKQDDTTRSITCLNARGSCKRSMCECDRNLANSLAEFEKTWNILLHQKWGRFDVQRDCEDQQPKNYKNDDRRL
jgi:hypothetical protein